METYNDIEILHPDIKNEIFINETNKITINREALKRSIYNDPFNTWEVVTNQLAQTNEPASEQNREEAENSCLHVLSEFARHTGEFSKFYSLLSKCRDIADEKFNFNQILCEHNIENEEFMINLYMVLLSTKRYGLIEKLDGILLRHFAETKNILNFEAIVMNGIRKHEHFIERFIKLEVDDSFVVNSSEFCNKLLMCKVIYNLNSEQTYGMDITWVNDRVRQLLERINPELLEAPLRTYFYEISRQLYVLDNIILKSSQIYDTKTILNDLLKESNIIEILMRLDFNILENPNITEYITKHLESKHKITNGQHTVADLEIYNEFIIVSNYIGIIQLDEGIENYLQLVTTKLDVIKKKFRLIDSFTNFVQLLEHCFVLIFMRNDYGKFVCSKIAMVDRLLNSLDLIVTQNKHFEKYRAEMAQNAVLCERYMRTIGYINDGLWRLSIFANKTSCDSNLTNTSDSNMIIKQNNIKYTLSPYKVSNQRSDSTDEEDGARTENQIIKYRRKPRKRRSLQRSGSDKINSQTTTNSNNNTNTTSSNAFADGIGAETILTEFCCQEPHHHNDKTNSSNNIIVKMLSSIETLAVICMNRGDFTTVRQIIKKHKMESTMLSNEIYLTDHFVQTKLKLAEAFKRYDEQDFANSIIQSPMSESSSSSSVGSGGLLSVSPPGQSTIQIIKNAAAIGLEVSQITNIIENFINLHRIKQSTDVFDIVVKYRDSYPFLKHYIGDKLQITYIIDIMLSLSTSYDICLILYNLINRYYNRNDCGYDQNDNKIGKFDNVGYYPFFKRVIENLNLYKKYRPNGTITVQTLLLHEVYSLDFDTLEGQLEIEKFVNENNNCDNRNVLIVNANSYALLSKVNNFFVNSMKLLHCIDSACLFGIDELLAIDLNRKIGEAIFVRKIELPKIEEILVSMNFDLTYVIAINLVERIEINLRETIDFGELNNRLMHDQLDSSSDTTKEVDDDVVCGLHDLNDMAILNYVHKKNVLISFLLANIFGIDFGETYIINSHLFYNFTNLKVIGKLAILFRNANKYLTVLNWDSISFNRIIKKFVLRPDIELPVKLKILQNLKRFRELNNLIDLIIAKLVEGDASNLRLIEQMTNINNKCDILVKNIYRIENINLINNYINIILYDKHLNSLDRKLKTQLHEFSVRINIYNRLSGVLHLNWKTISELSNSKPETIIERLLITNNFELLLEWCTIHRLTNSGLNFKKIIALFSHKLFEYNYNRDYAMADINNLLKIVENLPGEIIVKFYKRNLLKIKNIYIIKYLLAYLKTTDRNYRDCDYSSIIVSLNIFEILLDLNFDVNNLFLLFNSPLLIIEQFLMNSKFDLLQKIIGRVRAVIDPKAKCTICESNQNNFSYDIILFYRKNTSTSGSGTEGLHDSIDYLHTNLISNDCIDLLLRIYATKSLDFRIITDKNNSLNDLLSLSQSLISIDSMSMASEKFIMPRTPPTKENWINDKETSLCMCCKRSIFTLLTRRHHCRRCGRVVCHSCSINRMIIPNMYDNIFVRFCNECFNQTEMIGGGTSTEDNIGDNSLTDDNLDTKSNKFQLWELYGSLKHDNIVRDEFSYEFAPSVPLCLSILSNHVKSREYSQFLLFHCRKFESLLRPIHNGYTNPEIDYMFVTRLLHCLALAAKVYGSESSIECSEMIDRVEVLLTIVQNDCQYLLPMEPLNSISIRKLCDNLVLAEKWNLALELSLKCGLTNTGVMAAWGIACLRSGCYETAREKFSHCMVRVTADENNSKIINFLDTEPVVNITKIVDTLDEHITIVKRPQKSPPLLYEIIKIMELNYRSSNNMSLTTLERAKSTINSNASLKSQQNKRDYTIPSYEPAINILNTIETLKQTAQGNYTNPRKNSKIKPIPIVENIVLSRYYEEAMYYLTTYGSHTDIIKFLIKHKQLNCALTYILIQKCDPDIFINTIFLPHMKSGTTARLIKLMIEYSDTLLVWRDYIIKTCRFLESKGMLNSLYQIQILLNDPVRASMTCVKFFSMNCQSFKDLQNNLYHLHNAQQHLQTELELCQWVEIKTNSAGPSSMNTSASTISNSSKTTTTTNSVDVTFIMKLDSKTLNNHINTILKQIEITKFLYGCESGGKHIIQILSNIFSDYNSAQTEIPTLFNSVQEKIQVCVLVLVCGKNIEEGFGLVYRIIQDFNLNSNKIYAITARYLAGNNRILEVEKLIDCMKSNNSTLETLNCDEIIALSIQIAVDTYGVQVKSSFENLMKLITDKSVKINCHIVCGQLKTAYLLAVQNHRINDIKKIKKQAELTNQSYIVKLCEKKLNSVKM